MSYRQYNPKRNVELDQFTGMPVRDNQPKDPTPLIPPTELKYTSIAVVPGTDGESLTSYVTALNCQNERQWIRQWGCWINGYRLDPVRISDVCFMKGVMLIKWH